MPIIGNTASGMSSMGVKQGISMSGLYKSLIYLSVLTLPFQSLCEESTYDIQKMGEQQAFENGRLLRAQFKNLVARDYLKYAADLGNASAAYLYAMEVANYRTTVRTPPESQRYLLQAAQGGNRQAMRELYENANWLRNNERALWKQRYHDALIELGASMPSQAAYELALYYQISDRPRSDFYLNVAVGFAHPAALLLKAEQINQGEGNFPIPGSRVTLARETYLKAAEMGHIPAIRRYIQFLENKGKYRESYRWRQQALESGDIRSLVVMGNILSGKSERYRFVGLNLIQAKAYFSIYVENAGNDRLSNVYQYSQEQIFDISNKLTEREKGLALEIESKLKKKRFFNYDMYWNYY